jgi:hypothetical protein
MTVGELLAEEAAELAGIQVHTSSEGAVTWSRGGRPFATLSVDGKVAEFGLDAAVADAATRTPDVALSGRGSGWVSFAPALLDDHGADRAAAWFVSAYRRLEPRN